MTHFMLPLLLYLSTCTLHPSLVTPSLNLKPLKSAGNLMFFLDLSKEENLYFTHRGKYKTIGI